MSNTHTSKCNRCGSFISKQREAEKKAENKDPLCNKCEQKTGEQ